MIQVTWQSAAAYLLNDEPDWGSSVELRAMVPAHVAHGLTQIEGRRKLGDTLRLQLRYSSILAGGLAELRNILQAWSTEPVLCPLWPAWFDAGAAPKAAAAWYYVPDHPTAVVQPDAARPFAYAAYPLLVGRIEPISPDLLTDDLIQVEWSFIEDDAVTAGIVPVAFTAPAGLDDASGDPRPLFPFRPNWLHAPKSGGAGVDVSREGIGQGRAAAVTFYDQPAIRPISQYFDLFDDEPWQLLRFFADHATANFWLPGGLSEALLTADLTAASTSLPVNAPAARGDNTTVLLDDGEYRVPVLITGTAGNSWTLSGAVGRAFPAAGTRLESLVLSRLSRPEISISFASPEAASSSLSCVEVPWEFSGSDGETPGTTMGDLPMLAYLYDFSIPYPAGTQHWRFTSFERALSADGQTYTAKPIEHSSLTDEPNLDRVKLALKSRHFAGNPLSLMVPFQLEWPLQLRIDSCQVSGNNADSLVCLFRGTVESAEFVGPIISATAQSLSNLFDRRLPRHLVQPTCNWALFETGCGLDTDDWQWTGAVVSYDSATLYLTLNSVDKVVDPDINATEHYFAGGYMSVGAGAAIQYRMIGDSTEEVANVLILKLSVPLSVAPTAGQIVTFYAGCDGRFDTCKTKFDNGARFGGFPWTPPGNPSGAKIERNPTAGGKK